MFLPWLIQQSLLEFQAHGFVLIGSAEGILETCSLKP